MICTIQNYLQKSLRVINEMRACSVISGKGTRPPYSLLQKRHSLSTYYSRTQWHQVLFWGIIKCPHFIFSNESNILNIKTTQHRIFFISLWSIWVPPAPSSTFLHQTECYIRKIHGEGQGKYFKGRSRFLFWKYLIINFSEC